MAYWPVDRTAESAVVTRDNGKGRVAYFPGDPERAAWRSGDSDLFRLLRNSISWLLHGRQSVSVEGEGVVECFAWEAKPGFAVHLLNYTNPNMHRGWLQRHYPIGLPRVRMILPGGRTVTRVELLRSERDVPFRQDGNAVEFRIPSVSDYEVAALYA